MIDAPALFANQLFDDFTSVWNVVRELLTLSKQCLASRSSRVAPTFVRGDLVFPFFKVLHNHLCDQCLGPIDIVKVGLKVYELKHDHGCNLLFVCNCDMLS